MPVEAPSGLGVRIWGGMDDDFEEGDEPESNGRPKKESSAINPFMYLKE